MTVERLKKNLGGGNSYKVLLIDDACQTQNSLVIFSHMCTITDAIIDPYFLCFETVMPLQYTLFSLLLCSGKGIATSCSVYRRQ